jgi:hypothetical protein
LGEHFNSFSEFDRCLDSLAVMNGRAMSRYRTGQTRCIRVCRFGKLARQHSKQQENQENPGQIPDIVHGNDGHVDNGDGPSAASQWQLTFDDEESEDEQDWHFDSRYGCWTGTRASGTNLQSSSSAKRTESTHRTQDQVYHDVDVFTLI